MFRLLIADDEFIELSALSQYLAQELAGMVSIATANNGMELLSVCESFNPDIILTDVEMPGINGLVALRLIKRLNKNCKTIIHSAYNHFEYVRDALDLRSDAYILKPAKRQEILKVVQDAIATLQAEHERAQQEERIHHILKDLRPLIETECVTAIMLSDIDETRLLRFLELLELRFSVACMLVFQFLPFPPGALVQVGEGRKDRLEWMRAELEGIPSIVVGPYINDKITCLVTLPPDQTGQQRLTWVIELARKVIDRLHVAFGTPAFAGIGRLYDQLSELPQSYRDSLRALNERSPGVTVSFAGDSLPVRKLADPFSRNETLLLSALEARNAPLFNERLEKTLEDLGRAEMSLDQQKDAVLAFLVSAKRLGSELSDRQFDLAGKLRLAIASLQTIATFRDLQDWCAAQLAEMLDSLNMTTASTRTSHTNEAIRFIETNYMKAISLDLVAEQVGVSSYYLSHLFTQETGKTYIAWLTEFRVRMARQLLAKRNFSLADLAAAVGYANPTYFAKIFRKITSHTVREVNDRCIESEE